jgi:large subunit ribosomal protein L19
MKASILTKETILNVDVVNRNLPEFGIGDTIDIAQVVKDGDKERIQQFEGDVIAMNNNGISSTFTVRRIGANGVGVEKIFPYFSQNISGIRVVKYGRVRRAKLNYLKDRVGRAARIDEKVLTKEQKEAKKNA